MVDQTEETAMAATKIQAAHRGRAARKEVQAMREQEAAATKIQAVHRGRATRKQLKGAHASHDFVESTGNAGAQSVPSPAGDQQQESLSMGSVPVRFVIFPEGIVHTKEMAIGRPFGDVLTELSTELRIRRQAMALRLNGKLLGDGQSLESIGHEGGMVELELSVDVDEPMNSGLEAQGRGGLSTYIDVEIDPEDGGPRRVVQVYIENQQKGQMTWLGGYRNKKTGSHFLHATCQTDRKPKVYEKDRQFTRETQTCEQKTRSQQAVRDGSTQMARPDLLLDDSMDREMVAGKYMTSEEHHQLRVKKTIVIQRYTRGCKARQRAKELREKREERQAFLAEEAAHKQQEAEERRRREIERRMRPRTTADFEILYNELEAWRLQETQKINEAGLPEDERHAALQQLLHKETKLLQTIVRLKIAANAENRDVRIAHTLSDMSAPKTWEVSDGTTVEVHTPFTTRAKELMQLYNGLRLPLLSTDERLDVLLHVKWTVKEFDCNLSREIVELIDREADMLNRGRNPKAMDGLRRRIANLFLQFIETPEFNPEATRYQIIPGDFEMHVPSREQYRNIKGTQTIEGQ